MAQLESASCHGGTLCSAAERSRERRRKRPATGAPGGGGGREVRRSERGQEVRARSGGQEVSNYSGQLQPQDPPQSTPDSSWFCTPSQHEGQGAQCCPPQSTISSS